MASGVLRPDGSRSLVRSRAMCMSTVRVSRPVGSMPQMRDSNSSRETARLRWATRKPRMARLRFGQLAALVLRPADFAARQVDDGPAQPGALHLARPAERPPQHGLDAGQQFAGGERLDDVVVGPHLQAADAVVLAAAGREDDDRQRRPACGAPRPAPPGRRAAAASNRAAPDRRRRARLLPGRGRRRRPRPPRSRRRASASADAAADGLFVLDHHDTSWVHGRLAQRLASPYPSIRRSGGPVRLIEYAGINAF